MCANGQVSFEAKYWMGFDFYYLMCKEKNEFYLQINQCKI